MRETELLALLRDVHTGVQVPEAALERLRSLPYAASATALFDTHRELRTGMAEVIFAPGKTEEELHTLVATSLAAHGAALVTRLSEEVGPRLALAFDPVTYHPRARVLAGRTCAAAAAGKVAVVTAGTADLPVALEAALVLEHLGVEVDRVFDVGVAGLHRLLHHAERLRGAHALVVVAGMEGALPSVVAGLVGRPIVAVPTSVGYGASLGGIAALLGMLNACAPGVSVVNIDNGFGAACAAFMIARQVAPDPPEPA